MGFTVEKGSEKGSQKGFWEGGFQKVPRTPPRRVRPLRRAPYGDRQKFILARTHEKPSPHARNFHSRLKFSFSVWNFHSNLKSSIPGPVFLRPERGSEWKNYSRLKFHSVLKAWFIQYGLSWLNIFQSWGPLAPQNWRSTSQLQNLGWSWDQSFGQLLWAFLVVFLLTNFFWKFPERRVGLSLWGT